MSNTLLTSREFLTEKQAAYYLNMSVRTLQSWRLRGGGPVFTRLGARAVRYRRMDIQSWIESGRLSSTSQASAAL